MEKIRDRMLKAGPLWKAMEVRFDSMITAINELRSIVVSGQNPHKVNDTTNEVSTAAAVDTDSCIDLAQALIDAYEAHIGSTTFHLAADSTNVVTEVGVPKEIYALLNELKIDLNAHMDDGTSHTNNDDVTDQVAGANASSKATAIALANEIRASYEAHRVQLVDAGASAVHGEADATNAATEDALTATSTWTEIAALADDLRTQYTAHIGEGADVHPGGADSTNTVTASAVGTVTTALYTGLNELKTDFTAHIAEFGTSHAVKDGSIAISAANATTILTARNLANELKADFNDHITRGDSFTAIPSLDLFV
jgi:hypothetical protein